MTSSRAPKGRGDLGFEIASLTTFARNDVLIHLTPDESEHLTPPPAYRTEGPIVHRQAGGGVTPSVDRTMQSVARVYGENAIGVILSGMGNDGTQGMKAIKARGGTTIAQDENALIFGMPKSVIEAGLADQVLPAEAMAEAMLELATKVSL